MKLLLPYSKSKEVPAFISNSSFPFTSTIQEWQWKWGEIFPTALPQWKPTGFTGIVEDVLVQPRRIWPIFFYFYFFPMRCSQCIITQKWLKQGEKCNILEYHAGWLTFICCFTDLDQYTFFCHPQLFELFLPLMHSCFCRRDMCVLPRCSAGANLPH